jgi:hypothetical protein
MFSKAIFVPREPFKTHIQSSFFPRKVFVQGLFLEKKCRSTSCFSFFCKKKETRRSKPVQWRGPDPTG